MAVQPAVFFQAARSALLRVLQGCRACAHRVSGEDRRNRLARLWQVVVRRLLRLKFKKRQFAFLGIHLRTIKDRGKAA